MSFIGLRKKIAVLAGSAAIVLSAMTVVAPSASADDLHQTCVSIVNEVSIGGDPEAAIEQIAGPTLAPLFLALWNSYGQMLYSYLALGYSPDEVCTAVGL